MWLCCGRVLDKWACLPVGSTHTLDVVVVADVAIVASIRIAGIVAVHIVGGGVVVGAIAYEIHTAVVVAVVDVDLVVVVVVVVVVVLYDKGLLRVHPTGYFASRQHRPIADGYITLGRGRRRCRFD